MSGVVYRSSSSGGIKIFYMWLLAAAVTVMEESITLIVAYIVALTEDMMVLPCPFSHIFVFLFPFS